ncbi:MAG: dihydrodipicolinate synthase family protein [Roseovarius sp.]|nr:dihydrodipicolinate synthase family protein [Roseovarius sp.]MCY4292075.1 dihydrodipicolinate synthase family protein [Roseovarius sp.]
MSERFCGVITPLLTPYNDDLSIAEDLYLEHASLCLSGGAHYLSPFGTTGEAPSNTSSERMGILEKLISSGAAEPGQIMPGTGLCAFEDTLTLCRHAVDLGCAAVMILPPFFYVNASDDGLYGYFSRLIHAVGSDRLRVCLYNIPQMAGIGISPDLAARLNAAFPDIVVAYKDSSGAWENTEAVIRAVPGMSVFPGAETAMARAIELGGGGCISASCNSNIVAIRRYYDMLVEGRHDKAEQMRERIGAHRSAVADGGLIPALKSFKSVQTGDRRWLNLRPPLENAKPKFSAPLERTLG